MFNKHVDRLKLVCIKSCKHCKYTGDPVSRRLYVIRKGTVIFCLKVKSFYRGHEGVEDADSEGCAASEGLSEVQLSVGVIVIILVQELDIAVIDKFSDHRDIGAIHRALPLQHDGAAERRFARTLLKYRKKCKIIAIRK